MVQILPHVTRETCFALKGGTAINLFLRDMPRLSVDIDLTYLPIEPRAQSLANIGQALNRVAASVEASVVGARAHRQNSGHSHTNKIMIQTAVAQVKLEPNTVLRGTVFPHEERELVESAQDLFGASVEMQTLRTADLYGGKICAALDRQHPRDLFDIKVLMENEGVTKDIRKAFVIYLASHSRPISELLDPARKDIQKIYENDFVGMVVAPVEYEDLLTAREQLIRAVNKELTDQERRFLFSIKQGEPSWELLGIGEIEKLPALQWKLANVRRMNRQKHKEAVDKLKATLGL